MKTITERLAAIQSKLNAPKNQENKFGGYKYRSCEDILMAVKPLLEGLAITISDEVTSVGDRIYVKATATITDGENSISTTAFAREAASRKGMDESQITGATSSYARKYALNGLLLIDDNKDADHLDNRDESRKEPTKMQTLSQDQIATITALADEVGANMPAFLKYHKLASLETAPIISYHALIESLEKKRA